MTPALLCSQPAGEEPCQHLLRRMRSAEDTADTSRVTRLAPGTLAVPQEALVMRILYMYCSAVASHTPGAWFAYLGSWWSGQMHIGRPAPSTCH